MVSLTLSIPQKVKQKMEKHPEMNWSGFVRKAIIEKTEELSWKERMLQRLEKDKEFELWALKMGAKVKKGRAENLKKRGLI